MVAPFWRHYRGSPLISRVEGVLRFFADGLYCLQFVASVKKLIKNQWAKNTEQKKAPLSGAF